MSDLVDRLVGALEPTRVRSGNALDSVPEMREVLGLFEGVAPGATGGGQNLVVLLGELGGIVAVIRFVDGFRSRGPPLSPRNITRGLHLLQPVRVCVLGGGALDITLPRRGR